MIASACLVERCGNGVVQVMAGESCDDGNLIADDGLHPSGRMYTEWVDLIRPIVEEILNNKI